MGAFIFMMFLVAAVGIGYPAVCLLLFAVKRMLGSKQSFKKYWENI